MGDRTRSSISIVIVAITRHARDGPARAVQNLRRGLPASYSAAAAAFLFKELLVKLAAVGFFPTRSSSRSLWVPVQKTLRLASTIVAMSWRNFPFWDLSKWYRYSPPHPEEDSLWASASKKAAQKRRRRTKSASRRVLSNEPQSRGGSPQEMQSHATQVWIYLLVLAFSQKAAK